MQQFISLSEYKQQITSGNYPTKSYREQAEKITAYQQKDYWGGGGGVTSQLYNSDAK